MPRKRKLSNLADRCRVCLARDACMSELFAEGLKPKLEDLQKLSGLQIVDKANYPRKICYVCLYKLEMWNEFKSQFLKTNKTLVTHFKIVEETVPEVNKSLDSTRETGDELLSDDNKKRPKIDSTNTELQIDNLRTPEKVKSPRKDHNDTVDLIEIEENIFSSVGKSQLSDNSVNNSKKGRSKKIEREASTKRWEERKNALIAATGEVPSESESDNGSQLSPVQKARVKARNIELEFEKQRKLQKALKNLQTDLTEKYKVSYEDLVITNERKTRSQQDNTANIERKTRSQQETKPNTQEICVNDNVKVNLLKSPLAEKKLGLMNAIKKEREKENDENKVENEKEEDKVEKIKEEKKVKKTRKGRKIEVVEVEENAVIDITEEVNDHSNEIEVIDNNSDKEPEKKVEKITVNKSVVESVSIIEEKKLPEESETTKKLKKVKNKNVENDIDVINLDDDVENAVSTSITENQDDTLFNPQELKSEVTLGNATYIVTTILDLPGSTPETKRDISLKTNGLNMNTTSQDSNKVDIMNAVQLQQVSSKKDVKEQIKAEQDVHQCLKIEIEGMEAQALQRVQLDLAHFVTDEIHHLLLKGDSVTDSPNKPNKHKDSYETLNHQLKAIVKKVLRSNFETDKLVSTSSSNNLKKFSPEFIEAANYSPLFQPQVVLQRLNFGQLCKTYNINNLHILEDAKRRRGVVGPLSRTLGKRRPVLPKRYEDFALSVQDEIKMREEENRLKNAVKAATTTASTNSTPASKPMVTIPATVVGNSTIPSAPASKTATTAKVVNKPTMIAGKTTAAIAKSTANVVGKSNTSAKTASKTPGTMATIAKIKSEIPPVSKLKSTIPDSVDNLVMDWTDSDHSTSESPILQELSAIPFKNLQLPKIAPKLKELPVKKMDPVTSTTTITKTKSSMSVTKTTVPKASAQSVVQVISTTPTAAVTKGAQAQQKTSRPITGGVASPVSQKYRHLCGICKKELFSEQEAEAHVKSHQILANQLNIYPEAAAAKATTQAALTTKQASTPTSKQASAPTSKQASTPTSKPGPGAPAPTTTPSAKPAVTVTAVTAATATTTTPSAKPGVITAKTTTPAAAGAQQSAPMTTKPKLMRCKRCQAIVEAEQVKSHVCNSVKYHCTICECRFGAKHLLDTHMESTHPSTVTTPSQRQAKTSPVKEKQRVILIKESNEAKKLQSEENLEDILADKDPSRSAEGYSCFVCDKMFDDEVQMKEHLYMHSDEVNDDGDDKSFPCAFCFEKFQTEESLEAHVDKHLKDDGDEKINMLISLNTSRRERKRAMFRCEICAESFTSAMLLAMHMQEHEDEEAEAELQAQEEEAATAGQQDGQQDAAEPEPYVCTICDQMFESSEELSEHLDMHNGNAHVCILCEKPFSSIKDLQDHVNTHL